MLGTAASTITRTAGSVAAAESAIGLSILVTFFRNFGAIEVETGSEMKG